MEAWFIFRPSQPVRRLTFRSISSHRPLEVAWGARLLALDDEHIGQRLGTIGIYDLAVAVQVETLDEELHGRSVAILKLDVEGAEHAVLEGAVNALNDGRLRHIIFEDHHGAGSAVMVQLLNYRCTIFSIGWTLSGSALD